MCLSTAASLVLRVEREARASHLVVILLVGVSSREVDVHYVAKGAPADDISHWIGRFSTHSPAFAV
jgi:hypothetical protein